MPTNGHVPPKKAVVLIEIIQTSHPFNRIAFSCEDLKAFVCSTNFLFWRLIYVCGILDEISVLFLPSLDVKISKYFNLFDKNVDLFEVMTMITCLFATELM